MSDWTKFEWDDVVPNDIPQTAGHVAQIAYSDKFRKVMGIFRACASNRELSPRVLALTRAIIELNPAHYSVWDYRFDVAKAIGNSVFDYKQVGLTPKAPKEPPIGEDGDWLNQFTLSHAKNYQVWNYRQHLIDAANPLWFRGERLLTMMVFDDDAKNFHAWSHLKWVILQSRKVGSGAFGDGSSLLADCDRLLDEDVWNNSVWSFRYFVYVQFPQLLDPSAELAYVAKNLAKAPSNESVWSYLQGFIATLVPSASDEAKAIALEYSAEPMIEPRGVELLAELSEPNEAKDYWHKLCELEPMRRPYWEARLTAIV